MRAVQQHPRRFDGEFKMGSAVLATAFGMKLGMHGREQFEVAGLRASASGWRLRFYSSSLAAEPGFFSQLRRGFSGRVVSTLA